ncbi:hypothetical protein [Streptomyces griseorubiginosus]|uniref:Uncharacterized protein n=1 Tax=Streptomyces griseorubiginosus TaxID=67304 RepID=A0A101RVW0_9ACTN|nr:hypothetical protein [Streptomyces griseorubiginosus]KUN62692.1 hypothetical protein AQJ54_30565 [Streptomyces griseorubiginosus]
MGFFSNPEKADRDLTQHMLADIAVDLRSGPVDDFTAVVAGSLLATANAQGLVDDCGDTDAYPPRGHGYSRR